MYYPRNNYFINEEYNVICVIILNFKFGIAAITAINRKCKQKDFIYF